MAQMAPPEFPPVVALDDDDRIKRLHFRLWLISIAVLTILVTAWCITLGWTPGILALVVAKHVLVALLVMALGVDGARRN